MPDLFLNDRLFSSLSEHELGIFLEECDARDLKYIRLDDISWQLLPPLLNFTLLIKLLSSNPELDGFAQVLKSTLYRQGANVIIDRTPEMREDLSDVLNVQLFLKITENITPSEFTHLNLYYSLKTKEKSLAIIGGVTKNLNTTPQPLNYRIASYWAHLTSLKYYKILHSYVPSILLEVANPEIFWSSSYNLIQNFSDNLVCLYGNQADPKDIDTLKQCLERTKKAVLQQSQGPIKSNTIPTKSQKPTEKKTNDRTSQQPNTKSRSKSALGRKSAKQRQYGNPGVFSPPESQVNYFSRPSSSLKDIYTNQNQLRRHDPSTPVIMKSTFHKSNNSPLEPEPSTEKNHRTISGQQTLLQSLKKLEEIIDKK